MTETTASATGFAAARPRTALGPPLAIERISFDECERRGAAAIARADVPIVIEARGVLGAGCDVANIRAVLGSSRVALFTKPKDLSSGVRSSVTRIMLDDFFAEEKYNRPDDPHWFRIVANLRNRPDDVTRLIGRDLRPMFPYDRGLNSANIWINYSGQFGRSHFDEFENFNLQLVGRKRFLCLEPGRRDYYTRSVLKGFGHHSLVPDFEDADFERFPRLRARVAGRRATVLEPGDMLYLPIGWWHQVTPLDHLNININFWLASAKLLRRPYVFVDAAYKAAFRKLKGLYDYQPEPMA